ncbi:MAG TPA: hypothetical protein VJ953_05760 [Saprospiraceae bacterium]|nr:hypothetical protein [Saprospiraceae bacterium]
MTTQHLPIILYVLLSGLLFSCQNESTEPGSNLVDASKGEMLEIESRTDTNAVNPDQSAFVFYEKDKLEKYLPRERIVFMVWDTMMDQAAELDQSTDRSIPQAADNRPPLFTRECLMEKGDARTQCSYDAVQAYFQKNISYPVPAFASDERFIAYMSAVINERGEVKGPIRLMDIQGERCGGCIDEARRLIRAMPDWQPARYQGEMTTTRVSIPVFFRQVPDKES